MAKSTGLCLLVLKLLDVLVDLLDASYLDNLVVETMAFELILKIKHRRFKSALYSSHDVSSLSKCTRIRSIKLSDKQLWEEVRRRTDAGVENEATGLG